ncbi:MAG: hypothetical protein MZU91_13185 [Desulfosudis oleivorans]|nr:hypothetical protein [Desulfosudis oleivorans]
MIRIEIDKVVVLRIPRRLRLGYGIVPEYDLVLVGPTIVAPITPVIHRGHEEGPNHRSNDDRKYTHTNNDAQ